jgi:hypothetical protein
MKTIKLNAWQILALERALEQVQGLEPKSHKALVDLIANAETIVIKTKKG